MVAQEKCRTFAVSIKEQDALKWPIWRSEFANLTAVVGIDCTREPIESRVKSQESRVESRELRGRLKVDSAAFGGVLNLNYTLSARNLSAETKTEKKYF